MADLSLTAVTLASQPRGGLGLLPAGAAITAPAPVYTETDGTLKPADNSTLAKAQITGIAVLGAVGAGEYVGTVFNCDLDFGAAVLTLGVQYVLSHNAGKICPYSDLASTYYITYIGYPISTSVLRLSIVPTGQQKP